MKRILPILLAVMQLFLLCACSIVPPAEYVRISAHNAPIVQKTQTDAVTVENASQLERAIRGFVSESVEHGTIRAYSYNGNIEEDLSAAAYAVSREDPLGAYAVDYMNHSCSLIVSYYEIHIDITFRRSREEIAAISYITNSAGPQTKNCVRAAILEGSPVLALCFTRYGGNRFSELVREIYDESPESVMTLPQVNTATYPQTGTSRIAELSFDYGVQTQELRRMRQAVEDYRSSVLPSVIHCDSDRERAETVLFDLSERFDYREGTAKAPVYSLLFEGVADSEAAAKSWKLLCESAGIECDCVHGMRNGEEYWWNIVCLDGSYCHVDILRDLLDKSILRTYNDSAMTEYYWDAAAYPVCASAQTTAVMPEPTEESEQEELPPEEETIPEPEEESEKNTTKDLTSG